MPAPVIIERQRHAFRGDTRAGSDFDPLALTQVKKARSSTNRLSKAFILAAGGNDDQASL